MVQAKVLGGSDEILVCLTTARFRVVSCGHDDSQCYTDDNRVSSYATAKDAAVKAFELDKHVIHETQPIRWRTVNPLFFHPLTALYHPEVWPLVLKGLAVFTIDNDLYTYWGLYGMEEA